MKNERLCEILNRLSRYFGLCGFVNKAKVCRSSKPESHSSSSSSKNHPHHHQHCQKYHHYDHGFSYSQSSKGCKTRQLHKMKINWWSNYDMEQPCHENFFVLYTLTVIESSSLVNFAQPSLSSRKGGCDILRFYFSKITTNRN